MLDATACWRGHGLDLGCWRAILGFSLVAKDELRVSQVPRRRIGDARGEDFVFLEVVTEVAHQLAEMRGSVPGVHVVLGDLVEHRVPSRFRANTSAWRS